MKHLKKFNTLEQPKESNSLNEKVLGDNRNELEKYQKLFDEAYEKKDKASCKKYDKILIDLYQKI